MNELSGVRNREGISLGEGVFPHQPSRGCEYVVSSALLARSGVGGGQTQAKNKFEHFKRHRTLLVEV